MVAVVRPFALSVPPENDEDDGPRVAWLGLEIDGEDAFLFRREGDGKPAFMSSGSAQQACRLMSRIAPTTRIVWLTSEPLDVERAARQPNARSGATANGSPASLLTGLPLACRRQLS